MSMPVVCCGCQRERQGDAWVAVDAPRCSQREASHSLCPDCLRERYPGLAERVLARGVQWGGF